jgi:phosphoribosylglycinamide formyltransferase-1
VTHASSASPNPIALAVLISGSGTTLQNLIDQIAAGTLSAQVRIVIASRRDITGIEKAERAGLRTVVVERKRHASLQSFSREVFALCEEAKVDLICLAGWLCLLEVPEHWLGKVMNIHPALLPCFGGKGMYGHHVHEAVLAHGCKVSGCTVHYVDNEYDAGPIIVQRTCAVLPEDSPSTLAARVFEEEKIAYPEAIRLHQQGRLKIEGRRVRVLPPA